METTGAMRSQRNDPAGTGVSDNGPDAGWYLRPPPPLGLPESGKVTGIWRGYWPVNHPLSRLPPDTANSRDGRGTMANPAAGHGLALSNPIATNWGRDSQA